MNKSPRILENLVILAMLALTAACQKEESDVLSDIPEGAVMLTAESSHGEGKTSVSDTSVEWIGDGSESVSINGNDYTVNVSNDKAYITPGTGDNNPAITGSVYGYYSCGTVTNASSTSPTVTIPDSYDCQYDANGRQILHLPMVAYSSSVGNSISFRHVTAAVKVRVRNEYSDTLLVLDRVVVSSSNYKLSGTASVTLRDGDAPLVEPMSGSGSVTVNLVGSPTISSNAIREVQVPILPIGNVNTPPSITVEVYAHEDGNEGHTFVYTNTVASVPCLARNEMLSAGCRMTSSTGLVDEFDALATPLTFEAKVANSTVRFTAATTPAVNMQYSTDGVNWYTYKSKTDITLHNIGDKVYFRGNNNSLASSDQTACYSKFSGTGQCYLYGNIMSLLNTSNYTTATTLSANFTFFKLFCRNTSICSHTTKQLKLPATTLKAYCYQQMFDGCTGLTTAPELPASRLYTSCYQAMFAGCTGLIATPELPATSLANSCYRQMFDGCSDLTTISELSATSLDDDCYNQMFYNCISLTITPVLPAQSLTDRCYYQMFKGCSNLQTVICLATYISASDCTTGWLTNVASSGTFYKAAGMSSWQRDANGIPTGWTIINN